MNMMGLGVILLGLLMTLVFHWTTDVSLPNMVGLLCGAVTNTPALGAAQQALLQVEPADYKEVTDMALACAVAYPLGVVGVILAIILLKKCSETRTWRMTKKNITRNPILPNSISATLPSTIKASRIS